MFAVLERIAQVDPKYQDVLLLENYAAFQNRLISIFSFLETLIANLIFSLSTTVLKIQRKSEIQC